MTARRRLKTLAYVAFMAAPLLAAAAWTLAPAAEAALAALTYEPPAMAAAEWDDPERVVEVRRRVQKHFLHHDVYIPLEDIVAPDGSLALLMQKACGHGRLYVWIPFKLRLPIRGEKVFEWCWKPQTKEAGASA